MGFFSRMRFCRIHRHNRRGLFVISSLIMLIGMITVFRAMCVYYAVNNNLIHIDRLFGKEKDNLYKLEQGYLVQDYSYYEKYRDVLLELRENYDIVLYENTNIYPIGTEADLLSYVHNNFTPEELHLSGTLVPLLKIDNILLEAADIRDEQGNPVSLKVGEDGVTEVAVGSFYKGVMKVGDTFESRISKEKYRVVCILGENSRWVSGKITDYTEVISLDKYFIAPVELEKYEDYGCMAYIGNVYLYSEDGEEAAGQLEQIKAYAAQRGVYLDSMSFKELLGSIRQEHRNLYVFSFILAVLMYVTVLTAVAVISVVTWLTDCRDIGIMYSAGFGRRDLFKILLYENLRKLFWPVLLTGIYAWRVMVFAGPGNGYMMEIFAVIAAVFCLIMLLCSAGLYFYISARPPEMLLKGETD